MRRHQTAILFITLLTLALSGAVTAIQPTEYRSSFSVVLIDQTLNIDGYAAAKSAERLSQSLGQLVETDVFADKIYDELRGASLAQGNELFSTDQHLRREAWKRQVETRVQADVGLVRIAVFQPQPDAAQAIASTLSKQLVAFGRQYIGGGQNILFRIVDYPLPSERPARPNIILNLSAGLIVGLFGSMIFFWLRDLGRETTPAPTHVPALGRITAPMTPTPAVPLAMPMPTELHHDTTLAPPPAHLPVVEAPAAAAYARDRVITTTLAQAPSVDPTEEYVGWRLP